MTAFANRMAAGKISPKTTLAVVCGALTTALLTILEQVTGITIDPTAKVAIVGAVVTAVSGIGAYKGKPGEVVVAVDPVHPAVTAPPDTKGPVV